MYIAPASTHQNSSTPHPDPAALSPPFPHFLAMLLLLLFLPTIIASPSPSPIQLTPKPVCPTNTSSSSIPAPFSLYVLSMQWPFSVCSTEFMHTQICRSPPPTFTVRGLWPTALNRSSSPTCCGIPFSLSTILDIAPALRRFWPDFSSAANDQALWEQQWLKHGSCTGLGLRTYFRKVLELSRRYDFLRALNSQGIVASLEKDHDFDNVQTALNEATGGYKVRMRCAKAAGHVMLDAVQVCLHIARFATIDCPDTCLDGQVDCCEPTKRIRIPYWRHDRATPNETAGNGQFSAFEDDDDGFWIGHVAGFLVLAAGIGYWLFKQFLEQIIEANRPRPNRTGYTRIPAN